MRNLFKTFFSLFLFAFVTLTNAQLIYEYEGSRNLNSSPITIDVKGDSYDYHFIVFCDSSNASTGDMTIRLNSDNGSNYSRYYMRGNNSSASANVATSQTSMNVPSFTRNASNRNSLLIGTLTGSSGDERKVTMLQSSGENPIISILDYYWTNSVDEASEIEFKGTVSASYNWHIIVYQILKIGSQNSWQLIDKLSWSSESTEKSFTVDGDRDIQYMIDWDGDQNLDIECNNDNTSNYTRQRIRNNSGVIDAQNTTASSVGGASEKASFIVNAESGVDRLIYVSGSNPTGGTNAQNRRAFWWRNTADNLSSLDCTPASSATGTAKLYKRKNPYTTADSLPFQTIKTFTVSGDYSAGDTLSGLSLDDYKMVKIEWLGKGAIDLRLQFNSDTGSNYYRQSLSGVNSTASASSSTNTFLPLKSGNDAGELAYGETYIYPKSGEYRPILNKQLFDEDSIRVMGQWYLDSASEITSIKIYAGGTASMLGKIRISVLK